MTNNRTTVKTFTIPIWPMIPIAIVAFLLGVFFDSITWGMLGVGIVLLYICVQLAAISKLLAMINSNRQ